MRDSFRFGPAAAISLAVNGLLLMLLLHLGSGRMQERKEPSGLTVWALAAPMGEANGKERQRPKPEKPSPPQAIASAPPPPSPMPEPIVEMPAPVRAAAAEPVPLISPPAPMQPNAANTISIAQPDIQTTPATTGGARPTPRGVRDGLNADAPRGDSRSYAAKIRSWLYAHKIYPRRSRMRREEGIVRVQFVLDRSGRLLEGRVIHGSGSPALNQEGQAMLYRASPYPAAPGDVPGERIEFTVPIEFVLPT